MTTTMQDLAEFILARLAERRARVDEIPDWHCTDSARGDGWGTRGNCPICDHYMWDGTESVTKDAFWEHLEEYHDRTFVLAECESQRRIVEGMQPFGPIDDINAAEVLGLLALPFKDHPDWREEWTQ